MSPRALAPLAFALLALPHCARTTNGSIASLDAAPAVCCDATPPGLDAAGDARTRADEDVPFTGGDDRTPADRAPAPGDAACARGEVRLGGRCVPAAAPRPIAPLSSARVTSQSPTLRWELPPGYTGAEVEVCGDRDCAWVEETIPAVGTSVRAPLLAAGTWFWRLRGAVEGSVGRARSAPWSFVVGARSAPADTSWSSVPDLNGDGLPDLVLSAVTEDEGAFVLLIYLGTPTGPRPEPDVTIRRPTRERCAQTERVEGAGDVNGDGLSDLMVVSRGCGGATPAVDVYLGAARGPAARPDVRIDLAPAEPLVRDRTAFAAGDLNRDGYADLVVMRPRGAERREELAVHYGGPRGPATTPDVIRSLAWDDTPGDGGYWTMTACDFDADTFGDVLVGAEGEERSPPRLHLFAGGAAGIAAVDRAVPLTPPRPAQRGALMHLSAVGDVNGDGRCDLGVAYARAEGEGGTFMLYTGSPAGLSAAPTVRFDVPPTLSFGWTLGAAGDVNGDGLGDLFVGDIDVDFPRLGDALPTRVRLYAGDPTGLRPTAIASLRDPYGSDSFATGVHGPLGDIDGDGTSDLLFTVPPAPPQGSALIFPGGAAGPSASRSRVVVAPATLRRFGRSGGVAR